LIALLLLFVAYECLREDGKRNAYVLLAVAGTLALWVSYPALFILVGIGFGLGASELSKKDWRKVVPIGLVLVGFLASFAALYLFSLRSLISDPSLVDFWRNSFMPVPPWRNLGWLWNAFSGLIEYALALPTGTTISSIIAWAMLLLGVFSLFFRKSAMALVLVLPLPAVLAASAVEKYPFGSRLLLFALPILFLLMAEGVERSRTILRKLNPWLALAVSGLLAIALLYYPALRARHRLLHPTVGEDVKAVMSYLRNERLETDEIYVYYGAAPSFRYYAPFYDLQDGRYLLGTAYREEPDRYLEEISAFEGSPRVWFVFSHNCWGCMVDEEAYFVEHLDEMGSRIDEFRSTGAAVYLYDLAVREP
jgi:multisubunit Na+/H+ antiporter MnhB subunit